MILEQRKRNAAMFSNPKSANFARLLKVEFMMGSDYNDNENDVRRRHI